MLARKLHPVLLASAIVSAPQFVTAFHSTIRSFGSGLKMATLESTPETKFAVPTPSVTKMLINGKWVDSASGKTFPTYDPRNGEVICEVPDANADDIDMAVKAARKAFEEGPWPKMSGRQRGRILYKLADLMEQHADELSALESLDNGKPFTFSRAADIPLSIDHYRYFAGWADKIHGKTIPIDGNSFAYTLHEPIGVCGQIIPWNFPMLMQAWKWAPSLAAGNTVVLKLAEQTPLTALRVAELAMEAGIPEGVINVITGFGETAGKPLALHMDVDKIGFTGHVDTGKLITQYAGMSNLKRVSLELGGKSAYIVCPDADIDKAVDDAHFSLFINHGQCCCAGSRLFVHDDVHDEFVDKMIKKVSGMKVGDPFNDVDQGPQVSQEQMDKILGYIADGKKTAECAIGGERIGDKGYYVAPTVFTDVKDDLTIAKEEIFGPVMSILKWNDVNDVLRRANDNMYGLAAGVFTSNAETMQTFARGLKVGTVWCNGYNVFDAALPFGGYKMSGNGREKGEYALEEYLEVKTVTQPIPNPTWL
eukprot:CAMPEP_0113937976 /NCGR_PEP_ID=MMETSP1339-20121228/4437_1 /TAXON_ID=94617 /ORGANISM="Fibrocapsa japonica" /LENGTH=535 /DNA_ID=CAMNT_0000940899 /DNA_START=71 /DNA_END=1678 /DNA_ORIENTATION=+ /assembly_acc=CAM_ASM_000762